MPRFVALLFLFVLAPLAAAQGTKDDYERANSVFKWTAGKVTSAKVEANWTPDGAQFWYRNAKKEFVLVDVAKGTREVVTEDKLPKDAKPPALPKKKGFGKDEPEDEDEDDACAAQPPRRGNESPDGKRSAFTKDSNVWLRDTKTKEETQLSKDGKAEDSYGRVLWSPDSKRLIAIRTKAGGDRKVTLVESSPREQLQPITSTYNYLKPGDPIPLPKPHLFDADSGKEIPVSDELFPNPWAVGNERWSKDGKRFYFTYNQRGHTVMRLLAIDAETGTVTTVVNEECKTFFDYSNKLHLNYLDDTNEAIWMSERDGWNHLYLVDLATGKVKNITKGEWVVRGVDRVDVKAREVWFRALGIHAGQDPYHVHYCRVKFDGTGLVALTDGDGTHSIEYSPDGKHFVDTYSRVDLPPVTELRRTADGKKVCDLEKADATALLKTGWSFPERFVTEGRDGKTRHLRRHRAAVELRPEEEVSRYREHLRRAARSPRAQGVHRDAVRTAHGRTRVHRREDRRHGHQLAEQGVSRRLLEEPRRQRVPGPHPVDQGRGREAPGDGPVERRRHLRRLRRRAKFDACAAWRSATSTRSR